MTKPLSSIDPDTRRAPLCATAPLLKSLLPLVAGILIVSWGSPGLMLFSAVAACAIPVPSWSWKRSSRAMISASLLAGMGSALVESSSFSPDWALSPPRESRVVLEITELFNARKPLKVSGVAIIRQAAIPDRSVRDQRVAFYLGSGPLGDRPPALGEQVECRAVLTYLPWVGAPDPFQKYLLGRDIALSLNQGNILAVRQPAKFLERWRQQLSLSCQRLLLGRSTSPNAPGNVLASMLLGNRALLSDDRVELYRMTGTYHLFAVSGLHVGSVALCLFLICRFIRLPGALPLITSIAGTWFYVWLTGSSPSATRAGIMISCLGFTRIILRQPHLFPALVLSAWIVLLWRPSQLFHLGFQLSYGVVGAIILAGLPIAGIFRDAITRHTQRMGGSPRNRLWITRTVCGLTDLVCISISAGLASMPVIIQHFNLFTPGGLVVGILLNPLATFIVMTGCVSLILGPVMGIPLAGLISMVAWPAIQLIEFLLRSSLLVPGSVLGRSWPWPGTGTLLSLLMLLTAWLLQRIQMGGRRIPMAALFIPHIVVICGLVFGTVDS